MSNIPRLTSLEIENFKSLKAVKLDNLPPLVCLIGENGSGKSSVLNSLQRLFNLGLFSKDELLDKNNSISIKIKFDKICKSISFDSLKNTTNIQDQTVIIFSDAKKLLGFYKITADSIIDSQDSTENETLFHLGENLPSVAKYIQDEHPVIWQSINSTMREYVPGLLAVSVHTDETRRTYLRFRNDKQEIMLLPREVSDGTLLMLAYLVLLRHPKPHPILCLDEPEHHLYPRFLPYLAEEIESYAERAGTVFMASHSPQLVNSLPFESIYFCKKNSENVTEIHRLSDNPLLLNLYKEGDLAGNMMRSGILDDVYRV